MDQVVFDRRFRGPPASANGGYAAGIAARLLGEPASVRLRLPPPLDKPLASAREDGRLLIRDGDATVIEATASDDELDMEVPAAVSIDEARSASERYLGFQSHPFPTCFVCGPDRAEGDGLRVFPSPVEGRDILVATWMPTTDLADEAGRVRSEFVWAGLDCPGGWAVGQSSDTPSVLGTMAARILGDVVPGETYVAVGWPIGVDGRKSVVGSALFDVRGDEVARAAATWVALGRSPEAQRPSKERTP